MIRLNSQLLPVPIVATAAAAAAAPTTKAALRHHPSADYEHLHSRVHRDTETEREVEC